MDLTAITTPFGLLDAKTQAALKAHGGPYQWFADDDGWRDWCPNWDWPNTYRVKPAPPKPREWFAVFNGKVHIGMWPNLQRAETIAAEFESREIIHVREVIPE